MAATSVPTTMRAWQYSSTKGGLEKNLKLNASAALPVPKSDQHLVKIIATALNPVDYKPAELPLVGRIAITKPATPGIDYAGTIIKPASGSQLKQGQVVFGGAGTTPLAGGALREYAVAGINATAAVPDGVTAVDAATAGVAAITAYQSIIPRVKPGHKIFINGGSGGTGVFGIQLAKAAGCHVTTSCSTGNVELCQSLGADRVVDYKKENVLQALKNVGEKFDHAVDNVGSDPSLAWHAHEYLKAGSSFVMVGAEISLASVTDTLKRKLWPGVLGGAKAKIEGFWPKQKVEDLQQLGQWMAEGKVRAVIDERFSFEDAPKAIEKSKTGRARGKIVIDVVERDQSRT